jgi:hypothetical protein
MGFDVYGKAPTAREGEYFRRNIWGWHPLAYLVETLCPDEAAACQHWYSNDGDGLDAAGAAALAAKLEERRDAGDVVAYCAQLDALAAAAPPTLARFAAGRVKTATRWRTRLSWSRARCSSSISRCPPGRAARTASRV